MNKYIFLTLLILPIILLSCNNDGASIYAMQKRYKNFLNILPDDLKEKFTLDSKEYGDNYKIYKDELNKWIDEVLNKETEDVKEIGKAFSPGQIEYAINTLVSRNYERQLPYELMSRVKNDTDKLSIEIDNLLKDTDFSNNLYKVKMDEAIVHFNTDDTTFYYVWNYLIGIDRLRRFQ